MSASGYIDGNTGRMVERLCRLVRQPSVSATGEGIDECAELVMDTLGESGIRSQILRLEGAAPLVYGEVVSKANPRRTVLFYNHYDVQPAEPSDLWDDPPFSGLVRDGRVFGRGASDDKGELVARIQAVEALLKTDGDVPCSVKFVIEGEEETGSANLARYMGEFEDLFSCDGVIWEFGYVDQKDRPVVSLGMKGLLFVELSVRESERDAHSSLAVLIKNPAWRLVEAIHTLRDTDGRILVDDWYREVRPPGETELRLLSEEPFDASSFRQEFGVRDFVGGMGDEDATRALALGPTCNIAGLASGYAGPGAKTVLPGTATAKIDFRLVPDMDPGTQLARLERHLRSRGFSDVSVRAYHGVAAARTDPSERLVSDVRAAADEAFGSSVLSVSSAGTGPMHDFKILGAPCVSVGCTHVYSRIHSPNEFVRVDLMQKAARCMCGIVRRFAVSV